MGSKMYCWLKDLFPICRSLTGDGVRETLAYIKQIVPAVTVGEIASGTKVYDWVIPNEWSVREAFVSDSSGQRVVDFKEHNLHLVGYSIPFRGTMELAELQEHLYSIAHQPDAIPYVTSYYQPRWRFCLKESERKKLRPGKYEVVVDTQLIPGVLNFGEVLLKGREDNEIFISTYICHPSMANNELSGPVVVTALLRWLMALPNRRFSYRVVFIPETIGSIAYLSRNLATMKRRTVAGFNVSCVGDDRAVSFLPSRDGGTLSDRAARHILKFYGGNVTYYSFLERGSDERQYCSPGIDLPVVSIMRSKYGCFPEYHTSLDDLTLVSEAGLQKSYDLYTKCIMALEQNRTFIATCHCEPQLGKRGLYPTLSAIGTTASAQSLLDVFTYCDGKRDLIEIAETLGRSILEIAPIADTLLNHGLISLAKEYNHKQET